MIGPPGVGKGTQASMLKDRFGLVHLASGDIFRAELNEQTELGLLAKSYIDRGELVPDEVTIDMMAKYLLLPAARECGFLLDGFPRTITQAEALDRLLETMDMGLQRVFVLEVDDDVVVDRLSGRISCPKCKAVYHKITSPPKVENVCDRCGEGLVVRTDDRPDTVRERMKVFHESTAPVIDYYAQRNAIRRIDASQCPEKVFKAILSEMAE